MWYVSSLFKELGFACGMKEKHTYTFQCGCLQGRNADALALYFGEDPARCPFEQGIYVLICASGFLRIISNYLYPLISYDDFITVGLYSLP